jgi:raffinose/stachyose/melibiose transport system permease protein
MQVRNGRSRLARERRSGYWLYLVPMLVGFVAVVAIPFALNLYYSLYTWEGGAAPKLWAGPRNYIALLHDHLFWSALENSCFMIIAIVVIPTLIGFLLAATLFDYIGRQFGTRASSFLRATYYLPQILPIAVAGVLWSWILDAQNGLLTSLLNDIGIKNTPDWLGTPGVATYSLMAVLAWFQIGYPVVMFMAALQRLDPDLFEAAALDGAGWWRRLWSITVPQVRPETFVVVTTATVGALKVFAPIQILTQGGPESSTYVPSFYAYLNFFDYSRVGYGATIASVMSGAILLIAALLLFWQGRWARRDEA